MGEDAIHWWQSLTNTAKAIGAIATTFVALGAIMAPALWVTAQVDEAKAETVRQVKELEQKTVSEDVYNEHVARFEREAERAQQRHNELMHRVNLIGERAYRSDSEWAKRVADE